MAGARAGWPSIPVTPWRNLAGYAGKTVASHRGCLAGHPAGDGAGGCADTPGVLLGTLSRSGRTCGVLAERMDQAHLIEAMDAVMRRLGGTARHWRTARLATAG